MLTFNVHRSVFAASLFSYPFMGSTFAAAAPDLRIQVNCQLSSNFEFTNMKCDCNPQKSLDVHRTPLPNSTKMSQKCSRSLESPEAGRGETGEPPIANYGQAIL